MNARQYFVPISFELRAWGSHLFIHLATLIILGLIVSPLLSVQVLPVRWLRLLEMWLLISSHHTRSRFFLAHHRDPSAATGCLRLSAWCRYPMFPNGIRHRRLTVSLRRGYIRRSRRRIAVVFINRGVFWRLSYLISNSRLRCLCGWWSAHLVSATPETLPSRPRLDSPSW